jgi:monoamine oxidase
VAAAGRRYVVLEASERIGGRCITDTTTFGVPYDRGAHWLHELELNPLAKLAPATGLDVYPAPDHFRLRVEARPGREGEVEAYYAAIERGNAAIGKVGTQGRDVAASTALPRDLRDWRPTVDFVLGPFGCAKDLDRVSTVDFTNSDERDDDAFCRQGFGTLLAKLAEALTIRTRTVVQEVNSWGRGAVALRLDRGWINARTVVVTASTNVLASGRIAFGPPLPVPVREAFGKLSLGTYNHIAVELPGNPLGLPADALVMAKAKDAREAGMLANVSGTPLCLIDVGGRFGAELEQAGEAAMVAFAGDWLAAHFGADIRGRIGRTHATRWGNEPFVRGAFSCAEPGGAGARKLLMEPIRERVFFAGEAVHESLWGTVAGAWESGERAAGLALRRIGVRG